MAAMDVIVSAGTAAGVSFLVTQQLQPPPNASVHRDVATVPVEEESSRDGPTSSPAKDAASRSNGDGVDEYNYDWQRSTEENYRLDPRSSSGDDDDDDGFVGDFKEFRHRLDPTYHNGYVPERQALQDSIIRSLLTGDNQGEEESVGFPIPAGFDSCHEGAARSSPDGNKSRNNNCGVVDQGGSQPDEPRDDDQHDGPSGGGSNNSNNNEGKRIPTPWIVFTAGVYGAGKSHTIQKLQDLGCFPPRSSFVGVDPDEIRRKLPEFSLYRSDQAGELTQKEAGMVTELLTDIALSRGKNVVVDGSLRDAAWHEAYFRSLRSRFGSGGGSETGDDAPSSSSNLRIGILYVTAPTDEIYQRVERRGASTGRAVPPDLLERSMREVPEAIERLKPLSDFFLHVHNAQEEPPPGAETDSGGGGSAGEHEAAASTTTPSSPDGTADDDDKSDPRRSEAEETIFQEKCLSIVGYG
eukprot:CAMPEP_0197173616 /NCGR_PEP_ID=MMETSP1423-20130617/476_1 /TAXON_ID=476441 /ORGANISM="Pseudo-nitzschia heimii, Strain UNC1101" /LENGTH=466 /DNA_ID=CAMNT_0042622453 /DNA_START=329 /DNA_END=1729 /DNA_ORIENTATION=-